MMPVSLSHITALSDQLNLNCAICTVSSKPDNIPNSITNNRQSIEYQNTSTSAGSTPPTNLPPAATTMSPRTVIANKSILNSKLTGKATKLGQL